MHSIPYTYPTTVARHPILLNQPARSSGMMDVNYLVNCFLPVYNDPSPHYYELLEFEPYDVFGRSCRFVLDVIVYWMVKVRMRCVKLDLTAFFSAGYRR